MHVETQPGKRASPNVAVGGQARMVTCSASSPRACALQAGKGEGSRQRGTAPAQALPAAAPGSLPTRRPGPPSCPAWPQGPLGGPPVENHKVSGSVCHDRKASQHAPGVTGVSDQQLRLLGRHARCRASNCEGQQAEQSGGAPAPPARLGLRRRQTSSTAQTSRPGTARWWEARTNPVLSTKASGSACHHKVAKTSTMLLVSERV
jgi:hypothetical protein